MTKNYTKSLLTAAKTIEITRADMPDAIEDGWVRMRLATASICGTDMHYFRHFANAGFYLDYPVSLGHEACAYVVDANGHDFAVDELVAINPVIDCRSNEERESVPINITANKRFPGSATTKPHIDGFFRDYFDFPAKCLHRVPQDCNPDHLTFTEPLACAMHSVNKANVKAGDKVLITGLGPMGLLATIGAHAVGAEVHVTDLKSAAIEASRAVGATEGYLIGDDSRPVPENFYDVVIEASGSPHAFNQAISAVRKQGTISILSLIQPSHVPINLHLVTLKEVHCVGSILFTKEFEEALAVTMSGKVDFGAIIAGTFPVSQTQEACAFMNSGDAVGKVLIHRD